MSFYNQLLQQTVTGRQYLLGSPIIARTMQGEISVQDYIEFLTQAYYHVRHTVPLLMSVGARLDDSREWLRLAVAEYIEEELGHQEWILNDIRACGGNSDVVRHGRPGQETELMVAYAYDTINRVNPLGFFGMVLVLEGTSVNLATRAAEQIQRKLALPASAFSYLHSHGSLDQEHIHFYENLMNRVEDGRDQQAIIHAANMFYRLYAEIFRSLDHSRAHAA
jgi:pyrroloquinoline quinone (PQQ) biosynthesis protein C